MASTTLARFSAGNGSARTLARGLGWFSLALGATQLLAPRPITRALGMDDHPRLVQACGLREVVAGAGLLNSSDPRPWLWARIAGDAADLAALAPGLSRSNPRRAAVSSAFGAVAAVTALDILCAARLQQELPPRRLRRPASPPPDYSDRSGFPRPPDQMRGTARHLLETG